mmetsp:Transcript_98532/g.283238  ORF Transcript_98532/g.283238 Transcript_98532/m.283238 type:complete len:377 (+) Transcript_98532:162-1292(+)
MPHRACPCTEVLSLLLALLALLSFHGGLGCLPPLHVFAALLLQEDHSVGHALELLAALSLDEDRVAHLRLFGLVLLGLGVAPVLEFFQLLHTLLSALAQQGELDFAVVDFPLGVLVPLLLLVYKVVEPLLQEAMAPLVDGLLHGLLPEQGLQLRGELLLLLRVDAQERLLLRPQFFLLELELDVGDGFVFLQLLLQLLDFLVRSLRLPLVFGVFALQLRLQGLHRGGGVALLPPDLGEPLLLTALRLDLGHQVVEGHLHKFAFGLLEPFLNLSTLRLHLQQIPSNVRVLLEVPAQTLVALFQAMSDGLNLVLGFHELCLVAQALQLPTSGDERLVFALQVSLFLDDPRDLIAHELSEFIAVNGSRCGDAREETQFF